MEHDKSPPLPEPDHPADSDGCTYACPEGFSSDQMRAYAAQAVAAERELWRSAAEYAAHQLEKARIWNGTDWHYNPLHPLHYRSALERLRDVLRGRK